MWRMLAYVKNNTIKKEAYEYMMNMSFNLGQGLGHLFPYDNLAEINVNLIKEQCRRKGANVTYEGARKHVKCLKYMHDLSNSVNNESQIKKKRAQNIPKLIKEMELALLQKKALPCECFSVSTRSRTPLICKFQQ